MRAVPEVPVPVQVMAETEPTEARQEVLAEAEAAEAPLVIPREETEQTDLLVVVAAEAEAAEAPEVVCL